LWVIATENTDKLIYSSDGVIWKTSFSYINTIFEECSSIVWNGRIFIAGGTGTKPLLSSENGLIWNLIDPITNFTKCNSVSWNGIMWVVGGSGAANVSLARSYDGITWTTISIPGFTECKSVSWNGNVWVAVGTGATHCFAYSPDGITWTGNGKNSMTTCYSVTSKRTLPFVGSAPISVPPLVNMQYSSSITNTWGLDTIVFTKPYIYPPIITATIIDKIGSINVNNVTSNSFNVATFSTSGRVGALFRYNWMSIGI
jgi:hypothetical protein